MLCCLAVEYVSFSKRFVPELINFLAGTLHLAVQDKTFLGRLCFTTCSTHQYTTLLKYTNFHKPFCVYVFRAKVLKLKQNWLFCRSLCGATLQAFREKQWSAGVVRLWIMQRLEQEKPAPICYPTTGPQKWPWQRQSQVRELERHFLTFSFTNITLCSSVHSFKSRLKPFTSFSRCVSASDCKAGHLRHGIRKR